MLSREIEIAAPAARVWELLEDVRRLPEFSPNTEAVTGAPERLRAVGETYTQVGTLLGRRMESRWRVVALTPGQRLSSEGSPGLGVRYTITQIVEPLDEHRTRLRVELAYRLPGGPLGRVAGRAGVEALAARNVEAVLAGLKRALEA